MAKESSSQSSVGFKPAPGIILVDPLKKTKKSDYMAVPDSVDDPHRGHVVAIGPDKPFDANPAESLKPNVKIGDLVLYSVVGCEKTKLEYKGNFRHEFIIVPFARLLGVIEENE